MTKEGSDVKRIFGLLGRAIEKSVGAVGITDIKGKVIYVNDSLVRMWGYESDKEIIGRHSSEFWHGDGIKKTISDLKTKGWGLGEDTGKKKDGSKFFVRFSATMIKDNDNKPLFMFANFFDITDTKKAEAALKSSEDKYRSLMSASPDGILIVDTKGMVLECNDAFVKIFGYPLKDIVGKHFTQLPTVRKRDIPKYIQMSKSLLRGESPKFFEFDFKHRSGEIRRGDIRVCFLRRAGKIVALQAILRDITDKQKVINALKEKEERYRLIADNSSDLIAILSFEFNPKYLYASPSHKRVAGYSPEEMVGKHGIDFVHPDDRKQMLSILKTYLAEKAKAALGVSRLSWHETLSFRFRKKSGGYIDLEATADMIGGRDKILIISRDVTERKRTESILSESEKRFKDIVENVNEWIWEVDKDGKYTYSSPAVERILGYKPAEMIGKHFYDFFLPEESEKLKTAAFDAFGKRQTFVNFINRNLHKKGHAVWLSTSGGPILSAKGELLGYRGADFDITESKKMENELKKKTDEALRAKEELEKRVMELEKFSKVTIGRELKMVELKKRIRELERKLEEKSK